MIKATILIVEDDPELRDILTAGLRILGHRTLEAVTADEALDLLRGEPVDLVLTDVHLGQADGFALIEQARRNALSKCPRFVVMTGDVNLTTEQARTRGADDLLAKPFDRTMLAATVTRALGG